MSIENANGDVRSGLAAMFQAAQSGGDLRAAFNSPDSVTDQPEQTADEPKDEEAVSTEEQPAETVSASERQDDESQNDSETKPEEKSDKVEDIEEITFTDHKGRRTVKVDFSDRDKVRKLASLAYGSRKFQVERDQSRQELAKEREESKKLKDDMAKFESVYEKQGIKGLVMMLEGPEGYENFLKEAKAEQERWEEMDPAERTKVLKDREIESEREKARKSEEEYQRRIAELDKRQKEADEKAFEAKLHPAFDRYRFNGKLGDPVAEHRLDQALWDQTMDALQPYEDKGLEITQAMVDKEFRKASQELGKIINKQVDKKTKVAVQKAKTTAQTKAQAKVSQGMQTSAASEQFKKDINSGNVKDALRSFLSGNVKLTR